MTAKLKKKKNGFYSWEKVNIRLDLQPCYCDYGKKCWKRQINHLIKMGPLISTELIKPFIVYHLWTCSRKSEMWRGFFFQDFWIQNGLQFWNDPYMLRATCNIVFRQQFQSQSFMYPDRKLHIAWTSRHWTLEVPRLQRNTREWITKFHRTTHPLKVPDRQI